MSIRKLPNGRYQADVTNRAKGVRTKRTFDTKKEAQAWEAQFRTQVDQTRVVAGGIEDALERYLRGEAASLRSYSSQLSVARNILPFIEGRRLDEAGAVAGEMKSAFIQAGLKPATINRRLALLRRLCNLAFEWGWTDVPHGKRIKLLSEENERHFYLSHDEINALASHMPRSGDLLRIAAYTGMRKGELFLAEPGDEWIVLPPKTKTGKPRLIPIPKRIRDALAAYHWPLDRAYYEIIRREFEAARVAVGRPELRFHDARHTYASLLIQAGADIYRLKKAMGHSTVQMTMRYAHLLDDDLQDLARKLG